MSKNRIITILALSALLLSTAAFGQGRGKRRDITRKLASELQLTTEQRDRLRPVMEERRQQAQALKNDSFLTNEQRQAKVREVQKEYRSKLNEILTPDQKARMKETRKGNAAKRPGKRQPA